MVVSLRQKRPPSGEERGEKSVAIFEKKKKCEGSTFVAQKTSAYIENTSWKVLAYGIYARVVDVSEIERVSAANE